MRIKFVLGVLITLTVFLVQAQNNPLNEIANAMGSQYINSIEFSGNGNVFSFGQSFEPGERWPRFIQREYTAIINYQTPSMRLTQIRSQGEHPPRGGGAQAVAADQKTVQLVNENYAWQEVDGQIIPNNGAVKDRKLQLWLSPQGVIKAAIDNSGKMSGNILIFKVNSTEIKATINSKNIVEKVEYLTSNEVIGDYLVEVFYKDYQNFSGVMFPKHIEQKEDGYPTLTIEIHSVKANPQTSNLIPEIVKNSVVQPLKIATEKISDGIWYLTTPNARNWVVDLGNEVAVVEGFTSEARSLLVLEEIKKLFPTKPLRYVINTHHHYDHSGGLRTFVANGTTIVTHEMNKPFFEKAWVRPRTIAPDLLSKHPQEIHFDTVSDKKIISGSERNIELYYMKDTSHAKYNLLVFIPKEGLIYWGDGYNPPGNSPLDIARTPEQGIDIYRVIKANKLEVKTIAPAHGSGPKPYNYFLQGMGLPLEN
jgi:glyoxylase-like metal-dependent hydrolase (beta-lactamase superfamily II)